MTTLNISGLEEKEASEYNLFKNVVFRDILYLINEVINESAYFYLVDQ